MSIPQPLLLTAAWSVLSLHVNCHLLQREVSLVRDDVVLIYRYDDKSLGFF